MINVLYLYSISTGPEEPNVLHTTSSHSCTHSHADLPKRRKYEAISCRWMTVAGILVKYGSRWPDWIFHRELSESWLFALLRQKCFLIWRTFLRLTRRDAEGGVFIMPKLVSYVQEATAVWWLEKEEKSKILKLIHFSKRLERAQKVMGDLWSNSTRQPRHIWLNLAQFHHIHLFHFINI